MFASWMMIGGIVLKVLLLFCGLCLLIESLERRILDILREHRIFYILR